MKKIKMNYIIAIILFIMAIIKMYKPDILISFINKVDIISFLLIVFSVIAILYPKINKFLKDKYNKYSIWISTKGLLSLFCIVLVIIQMFTNGFVINMISLYLIIVASVVVILPDLKEILSRGIEISGGSLKLKLEQMNDDVSEVEKNIDSKEKENLKYNGIGEEVQKRFDLISQDSEMWILAIGIELEVRLRTLLKDAFPNYKENTSMYTMQRNLMDIGVLTNEQINLLNEFRVIKSKISHGESSIKNMSNEELENVANLGMRILKTLPTDINVN